MEPEEKLKTSLYKQEIRSDEVQEIITTIPKWIIRWGTTFIFGILGGIILLSSFIHYPDVVKIRLKVNSINSPKSILAKQEGTLMNLLVKEGDIVQKNQALAYLESTADHGQVLHLNQMLKNFRDELTKRPSVLSVLPTNLNLGELQGNYQTFYQQYLLYQSTQKNGYYSSKIILLEKDIDDIRDLKMQVVQQLKIQQQQYASQEKEYQAYQKLYKDKVISRSEFAQQENKYLSAGGPLQQIKISMLSNRSSYTAKEKELLDLKHTITEEQAKITEALNQYITACDVWISKYVLKASIGGKISFAGTIQQNQNVQVGQEVFIVNPGNSDFFGEVQIPQYNVGKIHVGERTLIKLHSYPFEQYGLIRGEISYISDVAYMDSVFIAKISFEEFENKGRTRKIVLKNGMQGNAEIITEESSLLQRIFRNVAEIFDK